MKYESSRSVESKACVGVSFTVRRMSLARRMELMQLVREAAARIEFHGAGDTTGDKLSASLASAEVDKLYLGWGVIDVAGLEIDGAPATPASVIEAGPERLCREMISEVKHECGLTEDERKN